MAEPDRPQSPFAGMVDFSARTPVRVLSPDEIERMLAEHRLYLETEYHEGHRANFSSADLTGRDFSGLNLRGIKSDALFAEPTQNLLKYRKRHIFLGAQLFDAFGLNKSGNLLLQNAPDAFLIRANRNRAVDGVAADRHTSFGRTNWLTKPCAHGLLGFSRARRVDVHRAIGSVSAY